MKQIPINRNFFPPMPVVLAGTVIDGKENFMTVGWCVRANANPPMIAIGIGKSHHTPEGIIKNGTFSISVPDSSMLVKTDYAGLVSGQKADKASLFETFTGTLENAPMITEGAVNLECRLVETNEFPTNYLFVGEIMNAYAREDVLSEGKPVLEKMDPMILTMPDNRYWKLDSVAGRAWKDGLQLKAN